MERDENRRFQECKRGFYLFIYKEVRNTVVIAKRIRTPFFVSLPNVSIDVLVELSGSNQEFR